MASIGRAVTAQRRSMIRAMLLVMRSFQFAIRGGCACGHVHPYTLNPKPTTAESVILQEGSG